MRGERGQVTVLIVGVLVVALMFVGVTVDGTRLLLARADARALADAAALAGASALDEGRLRASGGDDIALDDARAREAAARVLARTAGVESDVVVTSGRVEVRVALPVSMVVLSALGVQRVGGHAVAGVVTR